MQIGEAAQRSGLTVKTVRYYANIGMVTPRQDKNTKYRVYNEDDVAKLQFVGKARRFNFSVEECRELLSLYEDRNRPSREVKAMTVKKIGEIDARLAELQSLKDELSTLAASCDGDHRSHCPILNALSGGSCPSRGFNALKGVQCPSGGSMPFRGRIPPATPQFSTIQFCHPILCHPCFLDALPRIPPHKASHYTTAS